MAAAARASALDRSAAKSVARSAADGYNIAISHPEGAGLVDALRRALADSGLTPADIAYVNAHATSTGLGDISETNSIKKAFGSFAKNGLLISSTKSMTGHLLGGAGGFESMVTVLALTVQTAGEVEAKTTGLVEAPGVAVTLKVPFGA